MALLPGVERDRHRTERSINLDDICNDFNQLGIIMSLRKKLEAARDTTRDPETKRAIQAVLDGEVSLLEVNEHDDLTRHKQTREIIDLKERERRRK